MGFNSGQWLVDVVVEDGAWQVISPRGSRRSHPLPSPLCPPFTLPLSGCGFFFFLATICVDLILVSNCDGWFVVELLLRQWILVADGCVVDVVAVVDDNGEEIIYYFNV